MNRRSTALILLFIGVYLLVVGFEYGLKITGAIGGDVFIRGYTGGIIPTMAGAVGTLLLICGWKGMAADD